MAEPFAKGLAARRFMASVSEFLHVTSRSTRPDTSVGLSMLGMSTPIKMLLHDFKASVTKNVKRWAQMLLC